MSKKKVRVRFAPSPTGPLHMGGVRTALFNYLFAKQHGGDFILRIEDTDSARFVHGAEEYITETFNWCGIKFDEGVGIGGKHAPYRQSERKSIYLKYAEQLIESSNAYYAFDTAEELDAARKQYEEEGKTFIYNSSLRSRMKTSLTLPDNEVRQLLDKTGNWVIRFKMPENELVKITDIIRGELVVNTNTLDDKVLWKKADELPTYHLANIVDDHLMEITHVIRGEEWLPSLPLHALLYRAFGWDDTRPEFAHLSLLLKPDGKGKLSKRDGDRLGFPVYPLEWKSPETSEVSRGYREDGYFPEAFLNLLALLGWNPGTEQELFTMDELIKLFDLNRVVKSGARFNPNKAKWFNQQYLKQKNNEELAKLYQPVLKEKGIEKDNNYVAKVCGMIKERVVFINDFWGLSSYFFAAPDSYDEKTVKKYWKEETSTRMQELVAILQGVNDFSKEDTEHAVRDWISRNEYPMGHVMNAFRLSIVGTSTGPSMFEIIEMIGKDETINRINKAIGSILF
ncbi:MAG: glutamate--tRNA ligase [Prevotellaceae bacterium]|jgi:glutamyl-tRNA synthetase|nr:glutamate--tRNA ligase [Prevotellaceae bacterium]